MAVSTALPQDHASQHGQARPVTLTANAPSNHQVKPNKGASIPDKQAIGGESESLASWQKRNGIDPSKQIRLVKLAHMRYQHPDLATITRFLQDFGMQVAAQTADEAWFRGYGSDAYVYYARRGEQKFLGGAFEVESFAELEKAAALPAAAGPIAPLAGAPGGGHILTLHDPEGFPVNLIYGQQPAEAAGEAASEPTTTTDASNTASDAASAPAQLLYNYPGPHKPRVRRFHRFTPGPAGVHKLGHFGLCVRDFPRMLAWYTRNFNLAPTDFLWVPKDGSGPDSGGPEGTDQGVESGAPGVEAGARRQVSVFAHIDRGDAPVDHHTFFMAANATAHVHHASFEVHDYDTQHLGHQWLAKQGYKSVWGIGRHILGSQIFDYWWDTTGNMIEHYADGDLVNQDTPIGWGMAGDESLAVWGPEVPKWFLE